MNDLITMSIQGGRYLEAEKQLGDIILSEPSADAYFMLGTTKSNLLLDKGRSYLEVQFCFNKYLELSKDKRAAERNIMIFCVGLYSQLAELEKNLDKQRTKEKANIVWGALLTFASSKIIDSSKSSFGVISGIVGASFGIGMTMDGLSNLGSISDMISYVTRIQLEMIDYLKLAVVNEQDLLSTEILTLSERFGSIAQTDHSADVTILRNLGNHFIPPAPAIAMTKDSPGAHWNVRGFFNNKGFEVPSDDPVLGGLTSLEKDGLMEFLFTKKGVYVHVNSAFKPYNEIVFKKNFLGMVSINGSVTSSFSGWVENSGDFIDSLNAFVSQMK
jgi:hypothetical protein